MLTSKVFLRACCLSVCLLGSVYSPWAFSGSRGFLSLCICRKVSVCGLICSLAAMTGYQEHGCLCSEVASSQLDAHMCAASCTRDPVLTALGGEGQGFWKAPNFSSSPSKKMVPHAHIALVCLDPLAPGPYPLHLVQFSRTCVRRLRGTRL